MTDDKLFVGTELKMVVNLECEGFSMDTDPWKVTVRRGSSKEVVCERGTNTVFDGENWICLVDTSILGAGIYKVIGEIDVPDPDFADGYRHEVYVEEFKRVNQV